MKNLKKIMLSLLVGISLTACVPMPDDNMR